MVQDRLDELTEMRFRQFDRLSTSIMQSQQETLGFLQENTRHLMRLDERVENIETRLDAMD